MFALDNAVGGGGAFAIHMQGGATKQWPEQVQALSLGTGNLFFYFDSGAKI